MKILKILFFTAALIVAAEGCAQKKHPIPEGVSKAQVDSLSYSLGALIGENIKQSQFGFIDLNVFKKAMEDALSDDDGKALRFDLNVANNYVQEYFMQAQERMMLEQQKLGEKNWEEGQKYLEANKAKAGVVVTASGLQYKILEPGSAVKPSAEDMVEVHYRGSTIDGNEFDSSYKYFETVKFPLYGVIQGWTEGLQLIGEGGKIQLFIPSDLAYGEMGRMPTIEPNSVLVFEIELIKVNPE